MPHCSHGDCFTNSGRCDPSIKFAAFPKPWKDLQRARRWAWLMGRGDAFTERDISSSSYVCSLHFDVPEGTCLDWRRNKELEPLPAKSVQGQIPPPTVFRINPVLIRGAPSRKQEVKSQGRIVVKKVTTKRPDDDCVILHR